MGARSVFQINPIIDPDGISVSQPIPAPGDLVLNGVLVSNGVANLGSAHYVDIVSTNDDTGIDFTITGTDSRGVIVKDTFSGSNASTSTSNIPFKTIISISADAASLGTVEVGVSGIAVSDWFLILEGIGPLQVGIFVELSDGAILTYQEEHTPDNLNDVDQSEFFTFPHSDLFNKTTSDDGNIYFPPFASRIAVTAYTSGSIKATYIRYED